MAKKAARKILHRSDSHEHLAIESNERPPRKGERMRADLHIHTFYSDSFSSPENVVREAFIKRLDAIAITDHNEFSGSERAIKYAKGKGLTVIPGEEIMTDKGEIIGLFLSDQVDKGEFWSVLEQIKRQGALAILPHPLDRLRNGVLRDDPSLAKEVDGLEVFNSRVIFSEDNREAERFADENKLAKTGGSDAHFLFEIGTGWTEFECSGDVSESLRKAILRRKTKAGGKRSSPLVHGFGKIAKTVNKFRR